MINVTVEIEHDLPGVDKRKSIKILKSTLKKELIIFGFLAFLFFIFYYFL